MTHQPQSLLVTGGAGFIGANFVHYWMQRYPAHRVTVLDALTYAGNPANLADLPERYGERYRFIHGSILDEKLLLNLFQEETIAGVIHLAAESHVDRSIHKPQAFIETNVNGTCRLLTVCQEIWEHAGRPDHFRFLHVSTDEVFGSLGDAGHFTEASPYAPNSPYSASKAASDHFVRAWQHTYGLPADMDRIGAWARERGLVRTRGHEAGVESVRDVMQACRDFGIRQLFLLQSQRLQMIQGAEQPVVHRNRVLQVPGLQLDLQAFHHAG